MSDVRSLLLVTLVSLGGCKALKQIASTETPEDPATVLSDAVARIGLSVDLRPGDPGFGLLNVGIGTLPVTLDSILPTEHGSLVFLNIGNPTTAELSRLEATLQWGPLDADSVPEISKDRSRTGLVADRLPAGEWRAAQVLLPGAPLAAVGVLRISQATVGNISLKR